MESNDDIISPGAPISYFIVLTIIYIIFKISIITSAKVPTEIESKENITYLGIYSFLILIGNYIINTHIVKNNCQNSEANWVTVFFITFIPWIFIFGILYILLMAFNEWVKPFSNTIGYFIIKILGAKEIFDNVFDNPDFKNVSPDSSPDENKKLILQALINMRQNRMKIINEMSSDEIEFRKFINELGEAKLINNKFYNKNSIIFEISDESDGRNHLLELFKLVNIKDEIGKLVWYILAGLLITTIAYNHIINIECKKSIEEIDRDYEEQVENI